MTISQAHPNRKPHNWLIYDVGDQWLERCKPHIHGRLYDLGCGEMPYKNWLLNHASHYTGVDWGGTLHALKADIVADLNEPLPIDSEVADTVISLSVMEHLREPQAFLGEAYRILRGGGYGAASALHVVGTRGALRLLPLHPVRVALHV